MEICDFDAVEKNPVAHRLDEEMHEITMLLGRIAADSQSNEVPCKSTGSDTSLFTVCDQWKSRRKSHSTERINGGIKQRNNPPRSNDSLTRRERDYLYKTEEDNREDIPRKQMGFNRSYGRSGSSQNMTTSTPIHQASLKNKKDKSKINSIAAPLVNKAQQYLLDYLGLDEKSPTIQKGLAKSKTTTRKDTPLPNVPHQQQQASHAQPAGL